MGWCKEPEGVHWRMRRGFAMREGPEVLPALQGREDSRMQRKWWRQRLGLLLQSVARRCQEFATLHWRVRRGLAMRVRSEVLPAFQGRADSRLQRKWWRQRLGLLLRPQDCQAHHEGSCPEAYNPLH